MQNGRTHFIIGLVAFLAGGAVLALGGSETTTAVGTTAGIAGLGVMAWSWFVGRKD